MDHALRGLGSPSTHHLLAVGNREVTPTRDRNPPAAGRRCRSLGEAQLEHTVLVVSAALGQVRRVGHPDGPRRPAVRALHVVIPATKVTRRGSVRRSTGDIQEKSLI